METQRFVTVRAKGLHGPRALPTVLVVSKGTVIELEPSAGTRVHRPASVVLVVASGWPLDLLPDFGRFDLASARGGTGRRTPATRS